MGAIIFASYATKDAKQYRLKEIAEILSNRDEIDKVLYWQEDVDDNIIKYMNENLSKYDLLLLELFRRGIHLDRSCSSF